MKQHGWIKVKHATPKTKNLKGDLGAHSVIKNNFWGTATRLNNFDIFMVLAINPKITQRGSNETAWLDKSKTCNSKNKKALKGTWGQIQNSTIIFGVRQPALTILTFLWFWP